MDRPKLEVADVFRRYGEAYRDKHGASMSTAQRRVMTAIEVCRTAALGGHLERCDQCGHERNCFNSCRDRHCPKCQSLARAQWIEDRQSELLDCPVFPRRVHRAGRDRRDRLPEQGSGLRHSLPGHGRDSENHRGRPQAPGRRDRFLRRAPQLGAEPAVSSASALRRARRRTVTRRSTVDLLHARTSSCRSGFCPACSAACFWNPCRRRSIPANCSSSLPWNRFASAVLSPGIWPEPRASEWVVYAKRPFAGPQQVLDYVGRYTHRVAISNNRLLDIENDQVRFQWKDYRDGSQVKTMTLVRRRIHPAIPAPRLAGRFPTHSLLRLLGEPLSATRNWPVPPPARHADCACTSIAAATRITATATKNSPAVRCGSVHNASRVAWCRSRCCRDLPTSPR